MIIGIGLLVASCLVVQVLWFYFGKGVGDSNVCLMFSLFSIFFVLRVHFLECFVIFLSNL